MKSENPHMCFYNPPFLSMAHMGMGPEYQPDDAGFSATWPEASIRNSSSKETVYPPVCSPHKNEFFMVTSCWNLITMLQYATVIYAINIYKYIKIWYGMLTTYIPIDDPNGSPAYGQITIGLKAGGLMSNHPPQTWLLDRLSPHPLPSMKRRWDPGSDVMWILVKLGENLGTSQSKCLFHAIWGRNVLPFLCVVPRLTDFSLVFKASSLSHCQWYIPGQALENRKLLGWTFAASDSGKDSIQVSWVKMGECWCFSRPIYGRLDYWWLLNIRLKPDMPDSVHFSVDSPCQLWLVLGGYWIVMPWVDNIYHCLLAIDTSFWQKNVEKYMASKIGCP